MLSIRGVLAGACFAGVAGAAAAQSYTTYTIPASPTPAQHSQRPAQTEQMREDLKRKPLISAGDPVRTTGPLVKDGSMVSMPVKHGVTGVLTAEVWLPVTVSLREEDFKVVVVPTWTFRVNVETIGLLA